MNIIEQFLSMATNRDEEITAIRNATQMKFADDMGVELGVWIDMGYEKKFDEITKTNPALLDNLLDKNTHEATFEDIKTKIYH